MWNATIREVSNQNDKIRVIAEFTNGTITTSDEFNVTDKVALTAAVCDKLKRLNSVDESGIKVGDAIVYVTPVSTEKDEYAEKLRVFRKFVAAIHLGFTDEELAEFKALKKTLKDNFKPEYVDLF